MSCGNILFLTCLIPYEHYDEVKRNSKNDMQDAASALQWHLLEGLTYHLNGNFDIINMLPISSYPNYYSKVVIKEHIFKDGLAKEAFGIGFFNLKGIRKESIFKSLYNAVKQKCKNNPQINTILCYGLNVSMLKTLTKIKKQYPHISICTIVADLPDMIDLSGKKGLAREYLGKIASRMAYKNMKSIDKYVFLTKHMSDYLQNTKPFCVMEGIASEEFAEIERIEKNDVKTILYTGTLHRKFGVLTLLEAFSNIEGKEYRLVICGNGDSEDEIRSAAESDSRIKYMGQLSRSEILKLQKSATVLVNPRQNNEEFTKYSFPSKNLEYLSAGVPVIAYKLDGIPDEYDDYIIYAHGNKPTDLARKITETASLSCEEREAIGSNARSFVLEQKNPVVQTKKILELIGF